MRSRDPLTERLSFHPHSAADFEDSAAMWSDPATVKYIGGAVSTREDSWSRLLRNIGHWHVTGYGFWVVRDRASGRFVGEVGAKMFRRSLDAAWEDMPEIGWVLAAWAHGQGFATEATSAALAWGELHFGWQETLCIIDPRNAASQHVAAKCGFVEIARRTYKTDDVIVYRRQA
jgi:RimJ/RimL family protein N-acetyltransferase